MINFWHPETQKYYTAQQAQKALKILGLTPDNCEARGLFVPAAQPKPATAENERARLSPLPELVEGVWTKTWTVETFEITGAMVDAERDRRIDAGLTWQGKLWQSDADSRENINGSYSSALAYLLSGGQPDEVYWSDPNTPLTWLAEDNSLVTMTPAMMIDFGNAALAHKKAHIFAARTIKDMDPIPTDFTDDKWWP